MKLKGMTWSHDRGLKPLLAASEKFKEIRPDVTIEWDARSLADFELFPLEHLADKYDFIMIDHPHIGTAYANNLLLPLDEYLPKEFLEEQEKNCVGKSHKSYFWEGHQWALAADAAAQVSAWIPEELDSIEIKPPTNWKEVLELAVFLPSDKSMVIPFVPIHAYSSFYSLASQMFGESIWNNGALLDTELGITVLKLLQELLDASHEDSFNMDPIQCLDKMSNEDTLIYCPLTYGYSTYSLEGFRKKRVKFGEIPSATGKPEGSMIGGVGLSISSKCKHPDIAAEFVKMVLSPEFQQTVFVDNFGQAGHRSVWINEKINETYFDFYKDTLKTLDLGSMRPRFNGYIDFQAKAGNEIRSFIMEKRTDYVKFINNLNKLYTDYYNKK